MIASCFKYSNLEIVSSRRNPHKSTAGTSAVEFALVAPAFILLLFGCVAYGTLFATTSAVQQLVAESARATVGGLSDVERDQLARNFISSNTTKYGFLNPADLTVSTTPTTGTPAGFQVTITYDLSHSIAFGLAGLVPLPKPQLSRSAVVGTNLF